MTGEFITVLGSIYPKRQPSLKYESPNSPLLRHNKDEAPSLMKQPAATAAILMTTFYRPCCCCHLSLKDVGSSTTPFGPSKTNPHSTIYELHVDQRMPAAFFISRCKLLPSRRLSYLFTLLFHFSLTKGVYFLAFAS